MASSAFVGRRPSSSRMFAYSSSLSPSSAKGWSWSGVAAACSTVSTSPAGACGVEEAFSAVIAGSGPFVTRAGGARGRRARRAPPVYEREPGRGGTVRPLRPTRPPARAGSALPVALRRTAPPLLPVAQRLLAHRGGAAGPLGAEVRGRLVLALLLPAERDRCAHVPGAHVERRDEVEHVRAQAPQQAAQVALDLTAALGGEHAAEQEPGEVVVDGGETEQVTHNGEHGTGILVVQLLESD